MQLHDIKQVSIVDYLAQAGYKPKLTKGVNYWYCSPLRSELTPSFKVNAERNQWYDFATGDHGDIIDLVCALQHCSTAEATRRLAALKGVRLAPSFSFGGTTPVRSQTPSMELIGVQAVKHRALFAHPTTETYLLISSYALFESFLDMDEATGSDYKTAS